MDTFHLTENFTRAMCTAQAWHTGQYRKGTTIPYLSHPLGVAAIALEFGATEEQAIAALLHDALEDGPANIGEDAETLRSRIQEHFGAEVARLVDAATDSPKAGEAKRPWAARKLAYLQRLGGEDAAALLVSAADELYNARSILIDVLTFPSAERERFFSRFQQGQAGTLQYYRLLSDTYQATGARGQARLQAPFNELERTVTAIEAACQVSTQEVRAYPTLRS